MDPHRPCGPGNARSLSLQGGQWWLISQLALPGLCPAAASSLSLPVSNQCTGFPLFFNRTWELRLVCGHERQGSSWSYCSPPQGGLTLLWLQGSHSEDIQCSPCASEPEANYVQGAARGMKHPLCPSLPSV